MTDQTVSAKKDSAKTVLIIDGHSWMHRAFHAMQTPLTAPDGQPTNAVFGFFSMLSKTMNFLQPDALVVAFDDGKPTARMEALAQYKIQRKPTDPELKAQFPLIKELLVAMNVPVACVANVEGDDILGTLALQGEQAGLQVYLATSDRDAYQLVTDNTKVISQGRGADGPKIIGPAEVKERCGVTPAQIIDYLGLKGDSSDNIPGVPGVGEKTAAKLLNEFGTLDAVLEAAAEGKVKGKVGQNLSESRELAEVSRTVATILCDIPLDIDLASLQFGDYTAEDIHESFMRYGLRSAYGWMMKLSNHEGTVPQNREKSSADARSASAVVELPTKETASEAASENTVAALPKTSYKGVIVSSSGDTLFDTEEVLAVVGTGTETGDGNPIVIQDVSVATPLAQVLQESQHIAAPDLKALFTKVAAPDTTFPFALDPQEFSAEGNFDLSIAAYLLASHKRDFSLKELALQYAGVDLDTLVGDGDSVSDSSSGEDSSACRLAVQKARLVACLANTLEEQLNQDDSLELYRTIELPLIPVLARMEHAGISLDLQKLDELAQYGRSHIETLREEIFQLAGSSDFNPDSPKQLAEVLFDRLNLPVIKKTKTNRSTDATVLAELSAHHPIAAKITEYREFTKLQGTYLEALPKLVAGDGRIHTSFNQTVAATGRLSSSNPNLQNIPVRSEMGRRIREAFIPRPGWKLVSVDYSQIELRVLAQLSGDTGLIEAFNSGEDFHTETAMRIFGLDAKPNSDFSPESDLEPAILQASKQPKDIDASLRSKAKAVNFGIIYGQGPHGLAKVLDIPYGQAKQIIDRYYETFPRVKTYLDETVEEAKQKGWTQTYFGRKRHIPELLSPNRAVRAFGERTAMNHPMQGTAADLIKLAMIAIDQGLRQSGLEATMLLQVHDELVFEAPASECDQLRKLVSDAMTKVAPDFVVPLEVNVAVGDSWASAK